MFLDSRVSQLIVTLLKLTRDLTYNKLHRIELGQVRNKALQRFVMIALVLTRQSLWSVHILSANLIRQKVIGQKCTSCGTISF